MIHKNPTKILQNLVRFNTTNPPGHELACIRYINTLLQDAGIETTLLAKDEQRPNLIARLEGRGDAPPLLLQGHVDVVTTANQNWQHDPFAGEVVDGFVWGRGTLDMKGGVAMMVAALLRAKAEDAPLPGDVILTILSDEEAGGVFGAKFLVEEHPELFEGVQFALGEFGGFSTTLAGHRFYPIMVSEKQFCQVRLTLTGPGGHGSMPIRGGAMAQLGRVLQRLDKKSLPMHLTDEVRMMFEGITAVLPTPQRFLMGQLTNPTLSNPLFQLLGKQGNALKALLHHTVSPTIVQGGEKINVIPSEVTVDCDGRILPGFAPKDLVAELRQLLGKGIGIEVIDFSPGPAQADMRQFETLATILREADPHGTPIPLLLSGVTDARFFSRLGIQTYGFLPMQLPDDFNFSETIHAADERIPVEAVQFGANAIFQALVRMGSKT